MSEGLIGDTKDYFSFLKGSLGKKSFIAGVDYCLGKSSKKVGDAKWYHEEGDFNSDNIQTLYVFGFVKSIGKTPELLFKVTAESRATKDVAFHIWNMFKNKKAQHPYYILGISSFTKNSGEVVTEVSDPVEFNKIIKSLSFNPWQHTFGKAPDIKEIAFRVYDQRLNVLWDKN